MHLTRLSFSIIIPNDIPALAVCRSFFHWSFRYKVVSVHVVSLQAHAVTRQAPFTDKHQIDWDSAACITYSTDYYQRLTLDTWFTNLEQINACEL